MIIKQFEGQGQRNFNFKTSIIYYPQTKFFLLCRKNSHITPENLYFEISLHWSCRMWLFQGNLVENKREFNILKEILGTLADVRKVYLVENYLRNVICCQ